MDKITDIILINGKIETLSFFSAQLAQSLEKLGVKVHFHDFYDNIAQITGDIVPEHTALITFNCITLSGEEGYMTNNISIWRRKAAAVVNILVDHPMYYHDQLTNYASYGNDAAYTTVICIDKFHKEYLNRYYPWFHNTAYMPLAGAGSEYYSDCAKPEHDLIFTGNFTRPESFDKYIKRNGREYEDFYHGIIDELLVAPEKPIESVCIAHMLRDIPDAADGDIRLIMSKMLFIDLYVRFHVREKVITTLADAGIDIYIIGKGWEQARCRNGRTLHSTELMPTSFCLQEIAKSRISVNVMPWFRNGCHDRILSSMLCGAVSLTDSSAWIDRNFTNMKELVLYKLNDISSLPQLVTSLLDHPDILSEIRTCGHEKALQHHTWDCRAKELLNIIFS